MAEHMLKSLLERLNQLKEEYAEKPEELTRKIIAANVFDVMKNYCMDRRDVINLFGGEELSLSDLQILRDLNYED